MSLVSIDAKIDDKKGDIVGGILGWIEQAISQGAFGKGTIPFINGVNIDGWDLMCRLRIESEKKQLRFIVVKNIELDVIPMKVSGLETMDVVRRYDGSAGVKYWFEFGAEKSVVKERMCLNAFILEGTAYIDGKLESINLIMPCDDKYEDKRSMIMSSEKVRIGGMSIRASVAGKCGQKVYIIVSNWQCINTDLTLATKALEKIEKWQDMTPLLDVDGNKIFSDSVTACILANCFFSKETMPVFNMLIIGPKRNQKSAAIKFLVGDIMHGSVVSGSSSTGRGWLISHKEGADPSSLFSEKASLMIDEGLKFSSIGGAYFDSRGLVLKIKDHFVRHMEIIQREEIDSKSGNYTIRGKMSCSLFVVDNPDTTVLEAMGRAYKIADAAFRRWSYLYMDRLPGHIKFLTTSQAHSMMKKKFVDYGGTDAIRALMLLSRRKCAECDINADEKWIDDLKARMKAEVDMEKFYPEYSFLFRSSIDGGKENEELKKKIIDEIKLHIDEEMEDIIQGAWLSGAAMRGWELKKSFADYELVFDDEQKKIAEMIIRELFRGKIRIMFPGICSWLRDSVTGVQRKTWNR
jgi:hypothetical protein